MKRLANECNAVIYIHTYCLLIQHTTIMVCGLICNSQADYSCITLYLRKSYNLYPYTRS